MIKKGQKFNRLTAIKFDHKDKFRHKFWLFRCDCGNEKVICVHSVKGNLTKSCGCLLKKITKERSIKHGMYKTKIYYVWKTMRQRCLNRKNDHWKNYGGRGITICHRWLKFINFFADMGECPVGLSLDRINNNGNYCKKNCRWATRKEQRNNQRNKTKGGEKNVSSNRN